MTQAEEYLQKVCAERVLRVVFSLPESEYPYRKTTLRLLENGSYQAERFTETQAFHENFPADRLYQKLSELFPAAYRQVQLFTADTVHSAKLSKKGKLLSNRAKNAENTPAPASHNREKRYLLDADNLPPVFQELGVTTADGKIIRAKYDKFRQICRFLEQIDDVLSKDTGERLEIVDFGCGKSYLTFILYHYITAVLGKQAHIVGLDLKEEVIRNCGTLAKKYGYDGLEFLCMDVKDYTPKQSIDMVISLHACDIATDYALYFAVKSGAKYIFSVPCCQKEVNHQIGASALSLFTEHGLIKERFAALATDALRANLLEREGYAVDMLEFVDFDSSPKNLLIRASRRPGMPDRYKAEKLRRAAGETKSAFGFEITLEKLLARD